MPYPAPVPDDLSAPFWEAVNAQRLVVQHCRHCDLLQYPPASGCSRCGTADSLGWKEVEGRGHIREYLVSYDTRVRLKQADQPFNLAVVSLDEDPELTFLSNLPGTPVDEVPVGAAVEVVFVPSVDGQLVHEWKVVE